MGEVIGLDYSAVLAVFALYDIQGEVAIDLFERLVVIHELFLKDHRKKQAEREEQQKLLDEQKHSAGAAYEDRIAKG